MSPRKILIINGPNLNLLGTREPEIYGYETLDDIMQWLQKTFTDVEIEHFQSNHEGDIIDLIQNSSETHAGIILNAGALTHYSYSIFDCIKACRLPVVEVHISNPAARQESFRHQSVIAPACKGSIAGFGKWSYRLAVEFLKNHFQI